ncbi:MAG: peptidoglycan DD-metalloendopeptidase family protein, partial [Proteobacteria bacterium]|nr:peptidoglycan DD-metalloendopeptidase family protein [Pseudomonadota bacterium]
MPARPRQHNGRLARIAAAPALALLAMALATGLTTGLTTGPAVAQTARTEALEAVERALEEDRGAAESLGREAEKLKLEIRALRADSIAAARQAQEHEARLSDIETRLGELEREEAVKLADLQERRMQLTGTLAALQRIALMPADALIVAPGSMVQTVRSAMLLRVAIPAIESRAAVLRRELDELAKLRRRIAVQRGEEATTSEALEAERARIAALIRRKSEARAATTAEQRAAQERARRLAAEAKDLKDLLARIEREARDRAEREARELAERQASEKAEREAQELAEGQAREKAEQEARELTARQAREMVEQEAQELAERQAYEKAEQEARGLAERQAREAEDRAPAEAMRLALARPDHIRPFPDAQASLRIPARGRVVLRYGQSRADQGASKGISIRARGGAQVVAPYDGQVVYAGPFRRYGQILIIEHGGRYHTLLAGLDRIHAVVGQWLLAGEPVGVLGS